MGVITGACSFLPYDDRFALCNLLKDIIYVINMNNVFLVTSFIDNYFIIF